VVLARQSVAGSNDAARVAVVTVAALASVARARPGVGEAGPRGGTELPTV